MNCDHSTVMHDRGPGFKNTISLYCRNRCIMIICRNAVICVNKSCPSISFTFPELFPSLVFVAFVSLSQVPLKRRYEKKNWAYIFYYMTCILIQTIIQLQLQCMIVHSL